MLNLFKKKPQRPKTEAEELVEALTQYADRQRKRRRRKEVSGRWGPVLALVKPITIVVLALLVTCISLGVRFENQEFVATLTNFSGVVGIIKKEQATQTPAVLGAKLEDEDEVKTGPGSSATITFPDGSAVTVDENTHFVVRLLEFTRGGTRDRSFLVKVGSIFANVSQFFGGNSEMTVHTPSAVAAVRGTQFGVYYDPQSQQSLVLVTDGTVHFKTPKTDLFLPAGQNAAAERYDMGAPSGLAPEQSAWAQRYNNLKAYEKKPGLIRRFCMFVSNIFDFVLQPLGVGRASWMFGSTYAARRAQCQEALRRLRIHLETVAGEGYPEFLNPITLEELRIDPREANKILKSFAGNAIDSYERLSDGYRVRARAKDKKRTLYEMTDVYIQEIKNP